MSYAKLWCLSVTTVGQLVLSGVSEVQPSHLLSSEFRWCCHRKRVWSLDTQAEMVSGSVPARVVVAGGCDRQSSMASRWSPEAPLLFRSTPTASSLVLRVKSGHFLSGAVSLLHCSTASRLRSLVLPVK